MLLEKAKEYAQDCVSGKKITTFEVKTQCKWFLEDLEKQNNDYYPYYFDTKQIEIIEGILKLLNFATGLNIVGKSIYEGLENFQAFFIANIFGWRYKSDSRKFRYREVDLFIPRNSKTFLAALIIIILMLTEDEYSEFYSICLDRDLAGEVKKAISQILNASPLVSEYFNIPKTLSGRMECTLTHSFYQPRTAEANRNNSIRPSAFIADEYGAMKDNANVEAMRSGQLSVRNPLMFKLTTAYAEDKSIMLDELEYLKKIYKGLESDDRLFALVYYATEEHLWDDIGLQMANPLRIEENYEEIRRARKNALAKPCERTEFLTKNMNYFMPSNSGEEFITIDKLRLCKNTRGIFDWRGKDVYVGLDLAMTNDNTAVSMVTIEDDMIYAKSWAFIPADRIEEKNRRERTDYRRFIEDGSCFACGDEIISYEFVENFIMNIEKKYGVHIVQIAYDRFNCISTVNKLESKGYETVEVKQHSTILHMPTKWLQEHILQRKFSYDGDRLYEINFQNARCVEDTNLNKYINKKKSNGKVDMVMSTIDALYLLQQEILNEDNFVCQSF